MAADSVRPELVAYGYQLAASVGAARELAELAYARAGRASGRAELFREATAAYLASPTLHRRPLPTDLGGPSLNPTGTLVEFPEVTWLEPFPDAMLAGTSTPVRLEFVSALQHLAPRQRAVLVLRDVHGWPVADVATVLDASKDAVNGTLRRARAKLDVPPVVAPSAHEQRELLVKYARAFEHYDLPAILKLFDQDAVWEMPPFASWFKGVRDIGLLISTHCPAEQPGDQVLVPTKANGQPAFAVYMRDPVTRAHRAFQIQVLTLAVTGVVHAVAFFDLSLFEAFGLPTMLSDLTTVAKDVHDSLGPPQRPEVSRRKR